MIAYILFRIAVFIIGILPFSLLYICSDILAFLLEKVIRYRREVILSNLSNAFPDKSPESIRNISKKYYKNLSDISLEGVKGLSANQQTLIKRYHFKNPEIVSSYFEKGQSAIGLVAHYNNWEWGAFATSPQINGQVVGVSKSVKNKRIDRFFKRNRARFGAKIIHMHETPRALVKHKNTPSLFVLIADQSPSNSKTAHWLPFLNQDTCVLNGPDKIARRTNYPAFYFDVQRIRRGYYEISATLLQEQPKQMAPNTLTEQYMKKLESIIIQQPENWLWSHKRWKKKRDHSPQR